MNPWIERLYFGSPAFIQSAFITAYGARIRLQRFNRRRDEWNRFLERSEKFSRAELETYQDERLRVLIRHAYEKVPYYRNVMRDRGLTPDDIRSQKDLPKLPILTKDLIRRHTPELIAEGCSIERLKASPTSGTTGSPLVVYWDREADILWNVMIWRHRRWAGVEFGEKYGTLLGRLFIPIAQTRPPFWRYNRAWNQVLYSSFHLSQRTAGIYLEALRRSGVVALEAYPSTVYILALGLEKIDARLKLKAVFTSAEPLLDFQREVIQARFECDVFDYYGMSEAIMFAGDCRAHRGLHHHAEMSVVEILDAGSAPAEDGQVGRLVGTTLHNLGMPLIRYEIGDLSTRLPSSCSCGRAHPLYTPATGRADDVLVTPDGRLVSPTVMVLPFRQLKGLSKSKIIQEEPGRLRVLLVLDGGPSGALLDQLREGLWLRLGRDVAIDIQVVDDIPVGPTGKYHWVVSKVPLQYKLPGGGNIHTKAPGGVPAPQT